MANQNTNQREVDLQGLVEKLDEQVALNPSRVKAILGILEQALENLEKQDQKRDAALGQRLASLQDPLLGSRLASLRELDVKLQKFYRHALTQSQGIAANGERTISEDERVVARGNVQHIIKVTAQVAKLSQLTIEKVESRNNYLSDVEELIDDKILKASKFLTDQMHSHVKNQLDQALKDLPLNVATQAKTSQQPSPLQSNQLLDAKVQEQIERLNEQLERYKNQQSQSSAYWSKVRERLQEKVESLQVDVRVVSTEIGNVKASLDQQRDNVKDATQAQNFKLAAMKNFVQTTKAQASVPSYQSSISTSEIERRQQVLEFWRISDSVGEELTARSHKLESLVNKLNEHFTVRFAQETEAVQAQFRIHEKLIRESESDDRFVRMLTTIREQFRQQVQEVQASVLLKKDMPQITQKVMRDLVPNTDQSAIWAKVEKHDRAIVEMRDQLSVLQQGSKMQLGLSTQLRHSESMRVQDQPMRQDARPYEEQAGRFSSRHHRHSSVSKLQSSKLDLYSGGIQPSLNVFNTPLKEQRASQRLPSIQLTERGLRV